MAVVQLQLQVNTLSTESRSFSATPVRPALPLSSGPVREICCGGWHTLALSRDSEKVYTWGDNRKGQCGRAVDADTAGVLVGGVWAQGVHTLNIVC
jgi:alpha-tubulin suppressor-like RCC1 family protein